jgi:ABC-type maltose transport system permease subunit
MAASTFSTMPLIFLFLAAQKRIVASYTRSGMKD